MEDIILITKYDIGDYVKIKFHNDRLTVFRIYEINYTKELQQDGTIYTDLVYTVKRLTPYGEEILYINENEIDSIYKSNFM